ncbi:MAG: phenylacetic acid degradation protein PaaN [Phycisphaerales bacterium]|nr:phenylacetic acid degradation protein PaaN [Phycisphaerales bacterium]
MSRPFFDKHEQTLAAALEAIAKRGFFSAYAEVPSRKVYGETAMEDGQSSFKARLGKPFALSSPAGHPGSNWIGHEVSPYGIELGITYPSASPIEVINAAEEASKQWRQTEIEERVGICMEILARLNQQSFEMAFAAMHTTGQGFMMAFQAAGPHAQDRGLEAVAQAYIAMTQVPPVAVWRKQVSKTDVVSMDKRYRVVPKGIGLVIACSTFPTWNTYPGLMANLATGNVCILKPHPDVILPVAMTVQTCREVLSEAGFDPNVVMLAVDTAEEPVTKSLSSSPEVDIVDYTGNSEFGHWIETHATGEIFTEKAGVNSIIIDSIDDFRGMTSNIAFSLCLYSGQMCTAPQNIFIPQKGIETNDGHKTYEEVVQGIVKAINGLLKDPDRAAEVLGCVQSCATADRIKMHASSGETVVRASEDLINPKFKDARVRSPLILSVDVSDDKHYSHESFGPICWMIGTQSTQNSVEVASHLARVVGSITCSIYSQSDEVLAQASDTMVEAGALVSCNLTGPLYVNQTAAFSDLHVSGLNPSGNATLCDAGFVTRRFRIGQSRMPMTELADQKEPAHASV